VDASDDAHARSLWRDRKGPLRVQTTRTGVKPLGAKHHEAAHDRRARAGRRR
jgi:hypothetical protein